VTTPPTPATPARLAFLVSPRALILYAAVLWSVSSVFLRVLGEPLGLGLDDPPLSPLLVAFYRGLFAGLALTPFLKRADVRFRPAMLGMVLCFGVMSGLYLSSLGLGNAANAILLQNTAPFWVYLAAVLLLGERPDSRGLQAVGLGLLGAAVIVAGNWPRGGGGASRGDVLVLTMALGSGVAYAGVIVSLRVLRDESSFWLSVLNLLGSAGVVGVYLWCHHGGRGFLDALARPTGPQLAWIALFGVVQMAAPYWLFSTGLKHVRPQEAGVITLLEPILNPLWAYLLVPAKETPTVWSLVGGAVMLAALLRQYLPARAVPGPAGYSG